jgi:hypothetical protein
LKILYSEYADSRMISKKAVRDTKASYLLVGVEGLDEGLLVWVHGDLASEVLSSLSFLLGSDDLGWLDGALLSGLLGGETCSLCL